MKKKPSNYIPTAVYNRTMKFGWSLLLLSSSAEGKEKWYSYKITVSI